MLPTCRRGATSCISSPSWADSPTRCRRRGYRTLEADFCVEALNEATHYFGAPGIMNTDQGSQFTSFAWTDRLKRVGTRISMDGKGRCIDNVFIERLWKSLKYECAICMPEKRDHRPKPPSAAGSRSTITEDPAAAHRGLPQQHRNRSAGAGNSLNQPGNCPRVGE